MRVAAIVEGHGDVNSVPTLLARTGEVLGNTIFANNPIRAGEWKSIKARGHLHKFLELAYSRGCDLIMIILDLEDGCPVEEIDCANRLIENWKNGRDIRTEVAFVTREYETMFLWCQDCLPGFEESRRIIDPESIRDAKGAIKSITGKRYKETQDQLIYTRMIDLKDLYTKSRSYRRVCRAISGLEYQDIISRLESP